MRRALLMFILALSGCHDTKPENVLSGRLQPVAGTVDLGMRSWDENGAASPVYIDIELDLPAGYWWDPRLGGGMFLRRGSSDAPSFIVKIFEETNPPSHPTSSRDVQVEVPIKAPLTGLRYEPNNLAFVCSTRFPEDRVPSRAEADRARVICETVRPSRVPGFMNKYLGKTPGSER